MKKAELEARVRELEDGLEPLYDTAFEAGWRAAARWIEAKAEQLEHTARGLRGLGPIHADHASEVEGRARDLRILARDQSASACRPKGSEPG